MRFLLKRVTILALLLLLLSTRTFAESNSNSIIAIVNQNLITSQSLKSKLNNAMSYNEKLAVLNFQIDLILQNDMINTIGIKPKKNDIQGALNKVASNNNISMEQIESYPEYPELYNKIIQKLSIATLQNYVLENEEFTLSEKEISKNCNNVHTNNSYKQIKISHIFISQLEGLDEKTDNQDIFIKNYLDKLAKHITKGGSFEALAKINSQHLNHLEDGKSDWITVNNPTIKMLDLLKAGEVSKIYPTDKGYAIAIKTDERSINNDKQGCKEKLMNLKAESFYLDFLKNLRENAYIQIYSDKL